MRVRRFNEGKKKPLITVHFLSSPISCFFNASNEKEEKAGAKGQYFELD